MKDRAFTFKPLPVNPGNFNAVSLTEVVCVVHVSA